MFTRSISVMLYPKSPQLCVAKSSVMCGKVLSYVWQVTEVKSVNIKLHKVTNRKGTFNKSFSFCVNTKIKTKLSPPR